MKPVYMIAIALVLGIVGYQVYHKQFPTSEVPDHAYYAPPEIVKEPILTLTGNVKGNGSCGADAPCLVMDMEFLEKTLPQKQIVTTTAWHKDKVAFSGPSLGSVVQSAGINPDATLLLTATNDYVFEAKASELIGFEGVIATRQNGKRLDIRDKGPLWLVFPRDKFQEVLMDQFYDSYWIWNLDRVEAL